MTGKAFFLLLLTLATGAASFGQKNELPLLFKFGMHGGKVLQFNDEFLNGQNQNGIPITQTRGISVEIGIQTNGGNFYDELLKYPSYGVGFMTVAYPQTEELGHPNAFYGFFDGPFLRNKAFALKYLIRLGLSNNWNPADPDINPFNISIGSYKNLYVNAGLTAEMFITKRWSLESSLMASHFSNGRSTHPNGGINIFTGNLSAKFYLHDQEYQLRDGLTIEKFHPGYELYFMLGSGVRQEYFLPSETGFPGDIGVNYMNYNLSVGLQRQLSYLVKLGGGVDLIYYGPTNAQIELSDDMIWGKVHVPFEDKLQLGVFASFEWVMNNVSFYAQPGYRILRNRDYKSTPDFYQHLAFKYHMNDVILGMGIRSVNFSMAEYIEWNIGYRIKWRR